MADAFNLINYLTVQRDKGVIVWLFNIGAEKYWNRMSAGIIDRSEDIIVNRVEEMNLLLCREQDVLILREQPDAALLAKLKELGCTPPQIWVTSSDDLVTPIAELVLKDEILMERLAELAAQREDVYFVPYAVTYVEEEIAEKSGLRITAASSQIHAKINDKIFNRELAEKLQLTVCEGKVCGSIEEVRTEYHRLTKEIEHPFDKVIIKEPHGASGKGLYLVESEDKLSPLLARLSRFARNAPDSRWLVEGWYHKKADINYQIYVSPQGEVSVFSVKQQVLRDTVYIGSKVPADVNEEIVEAYQTFGQKIGKYLFEIGFTGVAGVDSILTSDDMIVPIIEINARFTLSTYISFIGKSLGKARVFSRYFKVITDKPKDYKDICLELEREGLSYKTATGEGVIVYTAGTLPLMRHESNGLYTGRLFTLIAGVDWPSVESYSSRLEDFVSQLSNLSVR
jgi:hypothetical protein